MKTKQQTIEAMAQACADALNSDGKVDADNIIAAEACYGVVEPFLRGEDNNLTNIKTMQKALQEIATGKNSQGQK